MVTTNVFEHTLRTWYDPNDGKLYANNSNDKIAIFRILMPLIWKEYTLQWLTFDQNPFNSVILTILYLNQYDRSTGRFIHLHIEWDRIQWLTKQKSYIFPNLFHRIPHILHQIACKCTSCIQIVYLPLAIWINVSKCHKSTCTCPGHPNWL